jgi:hypothetical protein
MDVLVPKMESKVTMVEQTLVPDGKGSVVVVIGGARGRYRRYYQKNKEIIKNDREKTQLYINP